MLRLLTFLVLTGVAFASDNMVLGLRASPPKSKLVPPPHRPYLMQVRIPGPGGSAPSAATAPTLGVTAQDVGTVFSVATTAGRTLVISVAIQSVVATPVVTASIDGVIPLIIGPVRGTGTTGSVAVYCKASITGGTQDFVVSANLGASSSIIVQELIGATASSPCTPDATSNAVSASASTADSGSASTTFAADIVMGFTYSAGVNWSTPGTDGQGHTLTMNTSSFFWFSLQYFRESAMASYKVTSTGGTGDFTAVMLAIKGS